MKVLTLSFQRHFPSMESFMSSQETCPPKTPLKLSTFSLCVRKCPVWLIGHNFDILSMDTCEYVGVQFRHNSCQSICIQKVLQYKLVHVSIVSLLD